MSILHIVNKSPYEKNSVAIAADYAKEGDSVLLIEDAVYAAVKNGSASAKLNGLDVSVLGSDLAARGVNEDKLIDGVSVIDYAGFVDLVDAKDSTQSWL